MIPWRFFCTDLSWPGFVVRLLGEAGEAAEEREAVTMSEAFVWFHNSSNKPNDSITFYASLLGWTHTEGPGGPLLAGDEGPFASVSDAETAVGWIPYAQVDDVEAATRKALSLGAVLLREKTRGPAGEFAIVRDPGGAVVALWQKG